MQYRSKKLELIFYERHTESETHLTTTSDISWGRSAVFFKYPSRNVVLDQVQLHVLRESGELQWFPGRKEVPSGAFVKESRSLELLGHGRVRNANTMTFVESQLTNRQT